MVNLINISQFQCIPGEIYGLQWAIKFTITTILIVGIFPSFFTGLIAKKRGFIYGCLVAFVLEILYVFFIILVLKAIAGGLTLESTYTSSQEFCKMATFIISGGFSVLVGGFMGLAGEKLREKLGKGK
jgi:hypothetical protein